MWGAEKINTSSCVKQLPILAAIFALQKRLVSSYDASKCYSCGNHIYLKDQDSSHAMSDEDDPTILEFT